MKPPRTLVEFNGKTILCLTQPPYAHPAVSRRDFLRNVAKYGMGMALSPVLRWQGGPSRKASSDVAPASRTLAFDRDWLFGGRLDRSTAINDDNRTFTSITLPHCVAKLSWENWDPAAWQDVWLYRKRFTLPKDFGRLRVFIHFDGVMVGATPTINGHELPQHLGGYLPFHYELTQWLQDAENTLDVIVDSRWSNVPPEGAPIGAKYIDYLEAGGIYRPV